MKTLTALIAALAFVVIAGTANAAALKQYKTEAGAQKHCPSDTVVYGDPASSIWHVKGAKNYGTMNNGRYVCQNEASQSGWRAAANGQ